MHRGVTIQTVQVFLSHNSNDGEQVRRLANELWAADITTWLDQEKLRARDVWEPRLENEVKNSAIVLACIGVHGPGPWQKKELDWAKQHNIECQVVQLPGWTKEQGNLGFDTQAFGLERDWEGQLAELIAYLKPTVRVATLTQDQAAREHPQAYGSPLPFENSPYPGINHRFGREHSKWFFGREREAASLITKLDRKRWLWVLGSSGSGKSSLVRAGVGGLWADDIVICQPSDNFYKQLRAGFSKYCRQILGMEVTNTEWEAVDSGRDTLSDLLTMRFVDGTVKRKILVVVDQAEEMFANQPERRERALRELLIMRDANDLNIQILMVLRDDYFHLARREPLIKSTCDDNVGVFAMTPDNRRRAIRMPALSAGADVETSILDRLVAESESAETLPLLQMALQDLWVQRGNRTTIGWSALSERARTENLLDSVVRRRIQQTQADSKRAVEVAAWYLASVGKDGNKRRSLRDKEVAGLAESQSTRQILDELVNARIVVATQQRGARVWKLAHDCVMTVWEELKLELEKLDYTLLSQLRARHHEWQDYEQDKSKLLVNVELKRFESFGRNEKTDAGVREFVKLSAEYRSRERKTRLAVFTISTLGLLGFAVFALLYGEKQAEFAEQQERAKVEAEKNQAAAEAEAIKTTALYASVLSKTPGRQLEALAKAVETVGLGDLDELPSEVTYALFGALSRAYAVRRLDEMPIGHPESVLFLPNERLVIQKNRQLKTPTNTAIVNVATQTPVTEQIFDSAVVSQSRKLIAVVSPSDIVIYDYKRGPEEVKCVLDRPSELGGAIYRIAFSLNDEYIGFASATGVGIANIDTCEEIEMLDKQENPESIEIALSLTGGRVATLDRKELKVWTDGDPRSYTIKSVYPGFIHFLNSESVVLSRLGEAAVFDIPTGEGESIPIFDNSVRRLHPRSTRLLFGDKVFTRDLLKSSRRGEVLLDWVRYHRREQILSQRAHSQVEVLSYKLEPKFVINLSTNASVVSGAMSRKGTVSLLSREEILLVDTEPPYETFEGNAVQDMLSRGEYEIIPKLYDLNYHGPRSYGTKRVLLSPGGDKVAVQVDNGYNIISTKTSEIIGNFETSTESILETLRFRAEFDLHTRVVDPANKLDILAWQRAVICHNRNWALGYLNKHQVVLDLRSSTFYPADDQFSSIKFNPSADFYISTENKRLVATLLPSQRKMVRDFDERIKQTTFSPKGRYLYVESPNTLSVLTGETLELVAERDTKLRSLSVTPEGNVVILERDRVIYWNPATGVEVVIPGRFKKSAVSPGESLLAVGNGSSIQIWDTGLVEQVAEIEGSLLRFWFSMAGFFVTEEKRTQQLKVWTLDPAHLIDRACSILDRSSDAHTQRSRNICRERVGDPPDPRSWHQ